MALNRIRLGDYIEVIKSPCGIPNLTPFDVSGINREKEFFEPSTQVGEDTSKYQIVPPGCFACNTMHVGRDRVLPIALNTTDVNKHVSPAYTVFKWIGDEVLLKEFLFMYLKSPERDRFFWFNCDSSVRDGMSWSAFCDVEISVPDIEIQRKHVRVYQTFLNLQQSVGNSLHDLRTFYEGIMDSAKKSCPMIEVKTLIREVDRRNTQGTLHDVSGIDINKRFIKTVADITKVDLRKYKIVLPGEIAFSGMQTGRDECIRIALNNSDQPVLISPAYTVFELNKALVVPSYFQMWFSRSESDRRGWFISDSSIRANLDLDRFYEIKIPLPSLESQKNLSSLFDCFEKRRFISGELTNLVSNLCSLLVIGANAE